MNAIREHESDTENQAYHCEKPSATFFRPFLSSFSARRDAVRVAFAPDGALQQ
jgi:hypothetical protein